MKARFLLHCNGGKIIEVRAIAHDTYRSVPNWFFECVVVWDGAPKQSAAEVAPFQLCAQENNPEAKAEVNRLLDLMNDYLGRVGDWHEPKSIRGGYQISWTPHEKAGREVLP